MMLRLSVRLLALVTMLTSSASSPVRWPDPPAARAGFVRLPATASIWLADTTDDERQSSAGRFPILKLKTIQETAAIRFDTAAVRGRSVRSARLFLHTAGANLLRYVRVSTVSQDWERGTSRRPYGPASGATYAFADASAERPWSYPGSEFADVIMGLGHSLTTYAERRLERDGWVSVALTPELVYALAAGHSDGLAVMDGGTPAFFNNFIHGASAGGFAPYIEVEPGESLGDVPAAPKVTAAPAPDRAHLSSGAIRVAIESAPDVLHWTVEVDGQPVPRWQVPFPPVVARTGREQQQITRDRTSDSGPVVIYLDDLTAGRLHEVSVAAVSRGGNVSPTTRLTAMASPVLSSDLRLAPIPPPAGSGAPPAGGARFSAVAVPGLVKIDPHQGMVMSGDMAGDGRGGQPNAVWDGRTIQLFGGRGEYVSYQLVIDRADPTRSLVDLRVVPGSLAGTAGVIGGDNIETYLNWYARNGHGDWQPAYTIPLEPAQTIDIPDRRRGLDGQMNQSVYVDVYIPRETAAGRYSGTVIVTASDDRVTLPIELVVYDFELPDELGFLTELNSYAVPANAIDFHRLAHQHRLAFNPWVVQPTLEGAGTGIRVEWADYDAAVGPLLSGEAFAGNRRAGVPTPVMYLPFIDSWPTPLSDETYAYHGDWPGPGDARGTLVDHYMTAPYIGDGLSRAYTDAFQSVQRQFVEHFDARGWNRTEMQLFFGGKNTHRFDYGTNMWWTTDEPFHWDDWLALQFFTNLWTRGRQALGADPAVWSTRADLSRPMWAGRVLDGVVNRVYWGGFSDPRWHQRAAWLAEHSGTDTRVYGAANPSAASNTQSVSTLLQVWLHGANGFMPWQTLGNEGSLDDNDNVDGNALLVPGGRFGLPVVGDMRLKALRDGQQLIEYLAILSDRYQLQREQVRAMLEPVLALSAGREADAALDDAEAARFGTLQAWQIAALRRQVADLIVAGARPR